MRKRSRVSCNRVSPRAHYGTGSAVPPAQLCQSDHDTGSTTAATCQKLQRQPHLGQCRNHKRRCSCPCHRTQLTMPFSDWQILLSVSCRTNHLEPKQMILASPSSWPDNRSEASYQRFRAHLRNGPTSELSTTAPPPHEGSKTQTISLACNVP